MNIKRRVKDRFEAVKPRLLSTLYRHAKNIPFVKERVEEQLEPMMEEVATSMRPYAGLVPTYRALPSEGVARPKLIEQMHELREREQDRWSDGYVSGAVYNGDPEHIAFLSEVYAIHSQANPLHSDLWPSAIKYEAEIIAMTANMLSGNEGTVGSVSSGGTESILLAMKAYRDDARNRRGIKRPNIVAPNSAHAAFDKAAQYFQIELRKIPVAEDFRADVDAMAAAVDRNTIVMVGSAPCFPHGVVDPIDALSEIALQREVGFHTDACLGGFVLPWAEQLGYPVPAFDFRLPGVSSISADTHKYGYAAKGTSVVLYRDRELRHAQYFTIPDWPGGLYFSPTFAGSRPGALGAACWAAMVSTGEAGYLAATKRILETAAEIREGIAAVPELQVLGDPLWVIAFASHDDLDIYRVMDAMSERGWNLNGLHRPACIHLAVTLRHTQPGVAGRFVADLRAAVADAVAHPISDGGMAPVYGMAASLPVHGLIEEVLTRYMDALYDP